MMQWRGSLPSSAAAAVAAATSAASTAAASTTSPRPILGFVHDDFPATHVLTVERADRRLRLLRARELDERKAARLSRLTIGDDLDLHHLATVLTKDTL
jgi:hypothetical protein